MKRFFKELLYDLKEPGINIWILPVAAVIFVMLSYILKNVIPNQFYDENMVILSALEFLIPLMGGYGALMLMQGIFDTEGGEISFTYSKTYFYWGIIRQARFFFVYSIVISAVCVAVAKIIDVEFQTLWILTLLQSFSVMAVAFFGVAVSKKVSVGLIILLGFVGIQNTLGREYDIFNWIYVISGTIPTLERLLSITFNAVLIGTFGFGIGQLWVRP